MFINIVYISPERHDNLTHGETKHMKNLLTAVAFLAIFSLTSCGSGKTTGTTHDSVDRALPPPADNNSANNPSLADTAYTQKDSIKKKK